MSRHEPYYVKEIRVDDDNVISVYPVPAAHGCDEQGCLNGYYHGDEQVLQHPLPEAEVAVAADENVQQRRGGVPVRNPVAMSVAPSSRVSRPISRRPTTFFLNQSNKDIDPFLLNLGVPLPDRPWLQDPRPFWGTPAPTVPGRTDAATNPILLNQRVATLQRDGSSASPRQQQAPGPQTNMPSIYDQGLPYSNPYCHYPASPPPGSRASPAHMDIFHFAGGQFFLHNHRTFHNGTYTGPVNISSQSYVIQQQPPFPAGRPPNQPTNQRIQQSQPANKQRAQPFQQPTPTPPLRQNSPGSNNPAHTNHHHHPLPISR